MQTVRIVNVKTGVPVSVESNADTFGELVSQLRDTTPFQDVDFSKCHCFVRDSEGRRSIGLSDELLPDDSAYTLYISPAEMKGGVDMEELREILEEAKEAIDSALELVDPEKLWMIWKKKTWKQFAGVFKKNYVYYSN